jgi:predicted acetyltransferase
MDYRPYDSERDKQSALRIWQECNWLQGDHADDLDRFIRCGRGWVADLNGQAECMVLTAPGDLRYLDETLPFSCVTGVTTSRVARKQGFAARLTAAAVAHEAAHGAAVVGLGMFEQGYYNRLGFGTGGYEHQVRLNPASLALDVVFRVPERLSVADLAAVHACRLRRWRCHGSVSLHPADFTWGRVMHEGQGYGLGYRDAPDGEISHMIWCDNTQPYHGPLGVRYLLFQTKDQLLELLALLKSMGDQIYSVKLAEPAHIQLQDLIHQPFAQHELTERGQYRTGVEAYAWWQMRICDLAACLARTHLPGEAARFNLALHDPIETALGPAAPWHGLTGDYVVALGPESRCQAGSEAGLPTLKATVNAFTRLWLGVRPASGLAVTDKLDGPVELLERLDHLLRLPPPRPDWDM